MPHCYYCESTNRYLKLLTLVFVLVQLSIVSKAQQRNSPYSLRVDLLQNPDRVYDRGIPSNISLEQALASNGRLEFCRINSRLPEFSWVVPSGKQVAFQIVLASQKKMLSDGAPDMWNPGKQMSSQSIGVAYKGKSLQPNSIYYWKVRFWNVKGTVSPYSDIQAFCTGKNLEDFALPSFVLVKTLQTPISKRTLDATGAMFDFGKDGFGQIRLTATSSNTTDTLVIHLGEVLTSDGHVDRKPPGTVRYRAVKIPIRNGKHSYVPAIPADKRNTGSAAVLMPATAGEVMPFRYVEIASIPPGCSIDSVSRYLVTNVFRDDATTFKSSDPTLNKIWELSKYTIKATSFSGYYVDGDRERIPYEADALINQLSHYASDAEFNMAKRTLDYLVFNPTWPTEWSLQNASIAWNDYLYSGDKRLVRKLYPELKAKLMTALARADGLISTRTNNQTPEFLKTIHYTPTSANSRLKDIVDWPGGERDGFVFRDYNSVVNAWYYAGLTAMARLAAALDSTRDAQNYTREAKKAQAAYQKIFFDPKTGLVIDGEGTDHSSLHANFFALAFDLVPKDRTAAVLSFIRSKGMACSVYGAQFLLDALYKANDPEHAFKLMTSTEKRSWVNMLNEGATMAMEAWGQSYKPNQDWNHAWGTAPANQIVSNVMGIQPLSPGFGEVQIKPHPGAIAQAELTYRSLRGDIQVAFKNEPTSFKLWIHLPGNTSGRVCIPNPWGKSTVKVDGSIRRAVFDRGHLIVKNVKPGRHIFEIVR